MSTLTPSRFGSLDGDSSFHLPIPGLLADLESGSAAIGMTDEFLAAPPAMRLRLVQQWLRGFRDLKDEAIVDMFRQSPAARSGRSIVEQIEAFREECQDEGISCPADLPILLQRF